MKNELVSFKTAALAKEKGFDLKIDLSYTSDKKFCYKSDIHVKPELPFSIKELNLAAEKEEEIINSLISAPIQSLLQRWLREVHNIDVYVIPNGISKKNYQSLYHPILWFKYNYQTELKSKFTYEEALEEGLYKALKLIK